MKNKVLLTVSGNIPENLLAEINAKERPRTDYIEMSEGFGADLIDYQKAQEVVGLFGRLIGMLGGKNALLAWACFKLRKQYKTIFTDGEQIGLPYAVFMRLFGWMGPKPAHLMIVHLISTRSKMMLINLFGLEKQIDRFLVYSTKQQEIIYQNWGLTKERVPFTPFMVDQLFFSTTEAEQQADIPGITDIEKPYICSVGLEFRDYPTFMEAVEGLDIHIFIAAGSPWSKREDQTATAEIPKNVTVKRFTQKELRKLYQKSQFVVMPLLENDFQAGITAILEAMALEKTIICSKTKGQIDVIQDRKNGLYVKPEDPAELRQAIVELLDNPELAHKMGLEARKLIDDYMSLDLYVTRLAQHIQETE